MQRPAWRLQQAGCANTFWWLHNLYQQQKILHRCAVSAWNIQACLLHRLILRCAGIIRTASTQWVPSAVSARMDSTAGRQIEDALILTSEIHSSSDCITSFKFGFTITMIRCASSTGTSYCGPNTHCNNTIGSFTCEERNCFDGQLGCQANITYFLLLHHPIENYMNACNLKS